MLLRTSCMGSVPTPRTSCPTLLHCSFCNCLFFVLASARGFQWVLAAHQSPLVPPARLGPVPRRVCSPEPRTGSCRYSGRCRETCPHGCRRCSFVSPRTWPAGRADGPAPLSRVRRSPYTARWVSWSASDGRSVAFAVIVRWFVCLRLGSASTAPLRSFR